MLNVLFRHHKIHAILCLASKPKVAEKKKKRNVITAVGHFISWCAEISLFGILGSIATAGQCCQMAKNMPSFPWVAGGWGGVHLSCACDFDKVFPIL